MRIWFVYVLLLIAAAALPIVLPRQRWEKSALTG